jgi:two-component sensor histidine kinase
VALEFSADEAMAGVDTTVPLGLLINEFFVNSIQHAFPDGRGVIDVRLTRETDDRARLTLTDDGPGFNRAAAKRVGTGLQIMDVLAQQLGGKLTWDDELWKRKEGARAVLELPVI